ncbi:MAG: hypothetical protein Q4C47_04045, partial [Planctomycetia bacterium]|nr:hypothetical protein [Planctomycetia bacterium]
MACSFSDENAAEQANQLVLELRKSYQLEAYVWEKDFTPEETLIGRGCNRWGGLKEMQYQNPENQLPEVAVLVGNYSSVDDPRAQETLERLRGFRPKSLGGEGTDQSEAVTGFMADVQRLKLNFVKPNERLRKNRGPLCKAFVAANPLLPKEFFRTDGVPQYLIDANSQLRYSLLKCPGRYSLKVGTFVGLNCIENSMRHADIKRRNRDARSELEQAEQRAHQLCEALRKAGYEAYEFHDVGCSMVTVGSFDRIGTTNAEGVTELDPPIAELMLKFQGRPVDREVSPNMPQGSYVNRTVPGTDVPLDVQPQLIEVPGKAALARQPGGTLRR